MASVDVPAVPPQVLFSRHLSLPKRLGRPQTAVTSHGNHPVFATPASGTQPVLEASRPAFTSGLSDIEPDFPVANSNHPEPAPLTVDSNPGLPTSDSTAQLIPETFATPLASQPPVSHFYIPKKSLLRGHKPREKSEQPAQSSTSSSGVSIVTKVVVAAGTAAALLVLGAIIAGVLASRTSPDEGSLDIFLILFFIILFICFYFFICKFRNINPNAPV